MPRSIVVMPVALMCACLQACVFLPTTIEAYDPDCQIAVRQMALQEMQIAAIGGCQNQACVVLVLAAGVTAAASAIVSGSIVMAGNVAYWFERKANCRRAQ